MEVDGGKVTSKYTSGCNSEGVYGFNVMLPTPIAIDKNKIVKMAATISGPDSYFLVSGGIESVEVDGVKVTFSNATTSSGLSNGTDKSRGQFYEIILSSAG